MGTLSGEAMRPAPRALVHASSSCGVDGRFAVGAAGALKDFPVCQRATQVMSVVTLIRGWVLARHSYFHSKSRSTQISPPSGRWRSKSTYLPSGDQTG